MHEAAGAVEPRSIRVIAAGYLAEVRSVAPDGPYFFGGWCLGGDVAYEMAAQARAEGLDVPLVVMVDNPRPAHIATAGSGSTLRRMRNRLRTRAAMEWHNLTELDGRARAGHVLGRALHVVRLAAVRAEARVAAAFDGTSIRLPMSRAYRLEQIAAAHEKAYQAYHPPDYEGQVALFRAEHQPAGRAADRSLGWAPHVGRTLTVHDVPGHRIGLLSEPRVGPVAGRIVDAMDQALTGQHATR
jgi:thioesterase domain-containing protein